MASLGSKVEFNSYGEWKNALPKKADIIKNGDVEQAQAIGKDFEGVAGRFDRGLNKGFIYAYYMKQANLYGEAKQFKSNTITVEVPKQRDTVTQQVLANKKNAAGKHRDKKQEMKKGVLKHKAKCFEGVFTFKTFLEELQKLDEGQKTPYQIRIESTGGWAVSDSWKDAHLYADSLDDIAAAVNASPVDEKAHEKFSLGELTEIVEQWIGKGPGPGDKTSWDEMDYYVKSHKDEVLKIGFEFSGVNTRDYETVAKKGIITIMPGN